MNTPTVQPCPDKIADARIAALEKQIADLKALQVEKTRTLASLADILKVAWRIAAADTDDQQAR
ncbi:MAG: hypothetical protein ACYDBJ_18050 [Aggregatilineales bacterium]